jgi:hypothetical protein
MALMSIPRFERFFRLAASLDVDKADLNRYDEFVNHEIYDLLLRAQATAKANARDTIFPQDLPSPKDCRSACTNCESSTSRSSSSRYLTSSQHVRCSISHTTKKPKLRLRKSLVGCIALARSFKIIDPDLKNPMTEHWNRAFALFDLVL